MFTSIVVGTDGSESAGRAVDTAIELARKHGARLHVVTAYTGEMSAEQAGLVADVEGRHDGVEVLTHVLHGDPEDVLIETADAVRADLVVVGSKGLGGVKGFLLGSVPARVSANAPCSVLIVRTT